MQLYAMFSRDNHLKDELKMHEECKSRDFHPLAMCEECEYFPCELVADWFTDIPSGFKETKR